MLIEPKFDYVVKLYVPKKVYDYVDRNYSHDRSVWIRDNLNISRWLPVNGMYDGQYTSHLDDGQDTFCMTYKFKNQEHAVFFALRWAC